MKSISTILLILLLLPFSVGAEVIKPVENNFIKSIELGNNIPTNSLIILGIDGSEAPLSELLLPNSPNIVVAVEFACPNQCKALLRLFRKVLSESKLAPGKDFNIITVGFGSKDTWELARQRALQAYERYSLKEHIEKLWVFGVGKDISINALFNSLGGNLRVGQVPHVPRVSIVTPDNRVSSIFTTSDLSTEGFMKSVEDARKGVISAWQPPTQAECVGSEATPGPLAERGLLAMRGGVVASLLLFFGVIYFLVRRNEA